MRVGAPSRTGALRRGGAVSGPRRAVLGPMLRRLRRRRGLTVADMADALDVDIRTYERLAAGRTALDLTRAQALAEALDADPLGLVAGLMLGRPDVAVAAADAKPLLTLALTLDRLTARQAERLARAPAAAVIAACDRLVAVLLSAAPE